ncbi:MAG: hypothetical protein NTX27_22045, partial [Verrucomicrobia bacterium]|nr:hypothetical protein [Verrucomicrobiota bacterium]
MKKLVLASLALTCAASVFAQGTVILNTRVTGTLVTHVYGPKAGAPGFSQVGNGANDTPVGATDWTGFTAVSGSGYLAALLSAPGQNAAEASLVLNSQTQSFRTGTAAGQLPTVNYTLGNVAKDNAGGATLQLFAWDNTSGSYSSSASAWTAWKAGTIAGGVSSVLNTAGPVGGDLNGPPVAVLNSFNIYSVP